MPVCVKVTKPHLANNMKYITHLEEVLLQKMLMKVCHVNKLKSNIDGDECIRLGPVDYFSPLERIFVTISLTMKNCLAFSRAL